VARFRNISGDDRHVGRADGPTTTADAVVVVEGDVVEEIDDAYIVGEGGDARAWPKATWELVKETGGSQAARPSASGERTDG